MQPIWLKHYPQGVPAAVDLRRFASLKELFEQSCRKFHDRPAFTSMGATLTYAETDRLSRDFAAYLQGLGLKPGERVAIMLPNLLQYPVALFGALRAGLVWSTSTHFTPRASCGTSWPIPVRWRWWCWRTSRTHWKKSSGKPRSGMS